MNPLHALALAPRVEASPYSPSSRRFLHPLYMRVADTAAYEAAPASVRAEVDALRPADGELVDHDAVWAAKGAALALLHPYDPAAPSDVEALEEESARRRHLVRAGRAPRQRPARRGRRGWHTSGTRGCPTPGPSSPTACSSTPGASTSPTPSSPRRTGRPTGMAVGLIADLAVGCSSGGADAWTLADALAPGVTVGAPPDDFNQQGQDWALPPWRPDALAASGYAPLRSMIRAVLRHADGIRVDHVAGLWRLWWIPPGRGAREGAYVHYDARAMLAVVAIEASRAGAVVVGEDLGTVEPEVTEGLAEHGMLGCAVLWFQRDAAGDLLPPRLWHPETLASVSTHDLPTAAGFLRDEHVRARDEAGLLDDVEEARAAAARDRAELLALLASEGFGVSESAIVRRGRARDAPAPRHGPLADRARGVHRRPRRRPPAQPARDRRHLPQLAYPAVPLPRHAPRRPPRHGGGVIPT